MERAKTGPDKRGLRFQSDGHQTGRVSFGKLLDRRCDPPQPITATLIRDFPSEGLEDVERTWRPARDVIARRLAEADLCLEHGHWDWRDKVDATEQGRCRLVALECEGAIQGLMSVSTSPRPNHQGAEDALVLYVDYLEVAPWNLRDFGQPRFAGVGSLLVAEAIEMSREANCAGRLGLHSLPQSETFYQAIGMTGLGRDPAYFNLRYFEYTELAATEWLASIANRS